MSWEDAYETDLIHQCWSGPHEIDGGRRAANKAVAALIPDILPILDIHKTSDCDLIYRFLIAKKWNVEQTAAALRDYVVFRRDNKLDELLWEEFPDDCKLLAATYQGFDRDGHPIYYDQPDPKVLGQLLANYPKDLLMRVHLRMMEEGRRLQRSFRTDRVSCVFDFSLMNMAIVSNPAAMRFMRELTHVDQIYFPENMRFMLICNGGWTFSGAYKIIKPWLDPRVQMKIHFMKGKAAMLDDLLRFIDIDNLGISFSGNLQPSSLLTDWASLRLLPPGTVPAYVVTAANGALKEGQGCIDAGPGGDVESPNASDSQL